MRLLVEGLPLAGGLIGAGRELSRLRPIRAGDILRVESEVRGRIAGLMRIVMRNQRDGEVQILVAKLIMLALGRRRSLIRGFKVG
jgi:acyl dehydratase